MNPLLRKLYYNPVFRIAALLVALALGGGIWQAWNNPDRSALKAPALALPQELAAHFSFSPQGNAVAACTDHNQLAVTFLNKTDSDLSVKQIRIIPLPPRALCAPFVWSPDGRTILMPHAVGTMEGSAPDFLLFSPETSPTAQTVPLPGGVDPNLLLGWSPDSNQVAYIAGVRTAKLGGLWLLDLKTRKARQLVLGIIQSPTFAPAGDRVYFEEDRAAIPNAKYDKEMDDWPHIWALGSIAVSGGPPTYLVKWQQGGLMPANDKLIATMKNGARYLRYFRSPNGEHMEAWELSGNGASRLLMKFSLEAGHVNRGVRWSAEGRRLAFIDSINVQLPNALKAADLDTGRMWTVVEGKGGPDNRPEGEVIGRHWADPAISADGLRLASTRTWVVRSESSESSGNQGGDDDDDGPQSNPVASTQKPLLLTLPS